MVWVEETVTVEVVMGPVAVVVIVVPGSVTVVPGTVTVVVVVAGAPVCVTVVVLVLVLVTTAAPVHPVNRPAKTAAAIIKEQVISSVFLFILPPF